MKDYTEEFTKDEIESRHLMQPTKFTQDEARTEQFNISSKRIQNLQMGENSIATINIVDANITTAKIASLAVTTAKIADLSVTTAKINNLAVTTAKIGLLQVTTATIADANITTAKIADANITTAKIADLNVTTGKINDLAVTTAKIANLAVTNAQINDLSATKINAGTLTVGGAGNTVQFVANNSGGGQILKIDNNGLTLANTGSPGIFFNSAGGVNPASIFCDGSSNLAIRAGSAITIYFQNRDGSATWAKFDQDANGHYCFNCQGGCFINPFQATGDPAAISRDGSLYYNTSTNQLRVQINGAWHNVNYT